MPRARKLTALLCSLLTAHFLPRLWPCTANEVQNAEVSFRWNEAHDKRRLVEHVTVPQWVFYAPTRIWRGGNSSWSLSSYNFMNCSIKCNGSRLFEICQPPRKLKQLKARVKSAAYDTILKQHLKDSHEKTKVVSSGPGSNCLVSLLSQMKRR